MRQATPEQMLVSPVGRYCAGRFFVAWVYKPTLIGTVYFGSPDETDFAAMKSLFALPGHSALARRYDVLVDCSRLLALPPLAFDFLSQYLEVAKSFSHRMRQVSIVRPHGHAGIVLAGVFYELVRKTFPAALFADRVEASGWLGRHDAAAVNAELDGLVDAARGTPVEVRRLREHLASHLSVPSLERAASDLHLSRRSLQRALRAADTTFRDQLAHARLRAAESLLADGDHKVEAVARQVGYSTLSGFTTAFRRATGERPSEFRLRRKLSQR